MGTERADHPFSKDQEVLESVAARLVEVYGESPDTDYIQNLRRIASKLQAFSRGRGRFDTEERLMTIESRLDEMFEAITKIHVLVMVDAAIANGVEIPEAQMEKLRAIVDSFE